MVERDLESVMQEQVLQLKTGLEPEQSVSLGKLVGAKLLVVAKLTVRGSDAELFAKLLRVETGEILSVAKAAITGGIIDAS